MAAQFVYWLSFPVLQETDVVVVQCMVLAHSHFDGILDSDLVSDGWDCAYVVIVKWVMWLMVWCGGVVVSVWRCGVDALALIACAGPCRERISLRCLH